MMRSEGTGALSNHLEQTNTTPRSFRTAFPVTLNYLKFIVAVCLPSRGATVRNLEAFKHLSLYLPFDE